MNLIQSQSQADYFQNRGIEQSWEHETRKRRVSCILIQTREPQVETRNKQEKLKNLHTLLDFLSHINFHCVLAFHPSILRYQ